MMDRCEALLDLEGKADDDQTYVAVYSADETLRDLVRENQFGEDLATALKAEAERRDLVQRFEKAGFRPWRP